MGAAAKGSWRSGDGRFAVRLVHLDGWRYWAFERATGRDVEVGLRKDGYGTLPAAMAAVTAVVAAEKRRAA